MKLRTAGKIIAATVMTVALTTGAARSCGKSGPPGPKSYIGSHHGNPARRKKYIKHYFYGKNPPTGYVWSCVQRDADGICIVFERSE